MLQQITQNSLAAKARRSVFPELASILEASNLGLTPSLSRQANIEALSNPGTIAVVTGQQCGLFLGPLFTIYKALSVVVLARKLQQEFNIRSVPVFWLQTEDHDFEEIRKTVIQDQEANLIPLELQPNASRTPVAYRTIGPEIGQLHQTLKATLGHLPYANPILEELFKTYRKGELIPLAFTRFLSYLTQDTGLVFFNPRSSGVPQLLAPIYEKAISCFKDIAASLKEREEILRQSGFEPQVRLRDASSLFFFHLDSAQGNRYRLQFRHGKWCCPENQTPFTSEELLEILHTHPDRFSSSALLRPLAQDFLFPTAAYIGGAAELNYFRQLEPLYSLFGIEIPAIVPRAHCLLLEARARKWLNEIGLTAADMLLPEARLLSLIAERRGSVFAPPQELENKVRGNIQAALAPMDQAFAALDKTLLDSLGKTKGRIDHALQTLGERYAKALVLNDAIASQRVNKLRNLLNPNGIAQERAHSSIHYLCRYGTALIDKLLQEVEPGSATVKDINL